jgi:hypothetical protein
MGRGTVASAGADIAGFGGASLIRVTSTTDTYSLYTYHASPAAESLYDQYGYNHFSAVFLGAAL